MVQISSNAYWRISDLSCDSGGRICDLEDPKPSVGTRTFLFLALGSFVGILIGFALWTFMAFVTHGFYGMGHPLRLILDAEAKIVRYSPIPLHTRLQSFAMQDVTRIAFSSYGPPPLWPTRK